MSSGLPGLVRPQPGCREHRPRWHTTGMRDHSKQTPSGAKTEQDANGMSMTDDEREARERFEKTGEPVRDKLGNADGAS
jgi:hypothetical protein